MSADYPGLGTEEQKKISHILSFFDNKLKIKYKVLKWPSEVNITICLIGGGFAREIYSYLSNSGFVYNGSKFSGLFSW